MDELEHRAINKVFNRFIPFLMVCYFVAFLDRVNLGFAALQMNESLRFSSTVFGFGAGVFFLGYILLEVPSSFIQYRIGARRWISRIMFTWGLASGAPAFLGSINWISTETQFYVLRFLLGAAEAGFFPGVIFFLTLWFPERCRGRIHGMFMCVIPFSAAVGAPASTLILQMDGILGMRGWQWIFLLEAIPAVILAVIVWLYLTDDPSEARWLRTEERDVLVERLSSERRLRQRTTDDGSVLQVVRNPKILTLGVVGFGMAFGVYAMGFFLPQIIKAFGVTNLQVGILAALPFTIGGIGMIWYGRRSDRSADLRKHTAIAMMIGAVGLVMVVATGDTLIKMIGICVASFGIFATMPTFWALSSSVLTGAACAVGLAVVNSIASLAGFIGPWMFGIIKDATSSFDYGLLLVASTMLACALLVLQVRRETVPSVA